MKNEFKNFNLLDCTLRDGSYALNFQFTKEDTKNICKELEKVGIQWIEIGHGVGLSASNKGYGKAAETDKEYMLAASSVLTKSKWGMFCIPGIAEVDDLKMAIDNGMDFVRIGVNPDELENAKKFIKTANDAKIFNCVNFMKSYTMPPEEFSQITLKAREFGTNLVYVVDSAGGMLPSELEEYIINIKKKIEDFPLGFHGHNNLGLGIANSLRAFELGVNLIDVALQGIGRGAGNASTEQFVCTLIRKGVDLDLDPIKIMDISENYFDLLSRNTRVDSIDTISGLSLFHSSYMNIIAKYAKKHNVDPRKLILSVTEKNQSTAPEDLVENEAINLSKQGDAGSWKILYKKYFGSEQI